MKAAAPVSVKAVYFEIGSHNFLRVYSILNAFKEVSDARRARTGQPFSENPEFRKGSNYMITSEVWADWERSGRRSRILSPPAPLPVNGS